MAGKPDDNNLPQLVDAVERRFHREMEAARLRWQDGDLTAFAQAVRLYGVHHREFPTWLVEASAALVVQAMDADEKRARREWWVHRRRWELVVELHEQRDELNKPRHVRNEYGEMTLQRDDRGMTMEKRRAAVSKFLKGGEAKGSARAVKKSYELVEAAGGEHATFESFKIERRRRSKSGQDDGVC